MASSAENWLWIQLSMFKASIIDNEMKIFAVIMHGFFLSFFF